MVKMKKVILSKRQLNLYNNSMKKANAHLKNRIKYILNKLELVFKIHILDGIKPVENLYVDLFCNYHNVDDELCYFDDYIAFPKNSDITIIDKYNNEIYLTDGIPFRWITEDFEKELIDGKKLYEQKQKEELKNKSSKIKSNKNLIKSALNKLTKEEKEALKIK